MAVMVQIRNVPTKTHRRLKSRAALAGMSMSEFLLKELERSLERPTREELLARIEELPPIRLEPSPEELIRQERDRR